MHCYINDQLVELEDEVTLEGCLLYCFFDLLEEDIAYVEEYGYE